MAEYGGLVLVMDSTSRIEFAEGDRLSSFKLNPSEIRGEPSDIVFATWPALLRSITQAIQGFSTKLDIAILAKICRVRCVARIGGGAICVGHLYDSYANQRLKRNLPKRVGAASGKLSVDTQGKILGFDSGFLELWNIPAQVVQAVSVVSLHEILFDWVENGDECLKNISTTETNVGIKTNDILRLFDGRFFERRSYPLILKNQVVGRVWRYRDITPQEHQAAQTAFVPCREEEAVNSHSSSPGTTP